MTPEERAALFLRFSAIPEPLRLIVERAGADQIRAAESASYAKGLEMAAQAVPGAWRAWRKDRLDRRDADIAITEAIRALAGSPEQPTAGPLEAVSGGIQEGLEASAAPPRSPDEDRCALCGEARVIHPSRKHWQRRSPMVIGHLFVEWDPAPQAPPSPDSPSQGERKQQLLDQDRAPSARSLTEFRRKGGAWLAAARSWIQWHCRNGSEVTWGSREVLVPPLTVADVEEIAGAAAWRALSSDKPPARPPNPSSASLESGGGTLDTRGAATLARSDSEER